MPRPHKKSLSSYLVLSVTYFLLTFIVSESHAKSSPLKMGNTTVTKPMKVTGQTRTLSMMLVLKNKKEKNEFINPREDYRREILTTRY